MEQEQVIKEIQVTTATSDYNSGFEFNLLSNFISLCKLLTEAENICSLRIQ